MDLEVESETAGSTVVGDKGYAPALGSPATRRAATMVDEEGGGGVTVSGEREDGSEERERAKFFFTVMGVIGAGPSCHNLKLSHSCHLTLPT